MIGLYVTVPIACWRKGAAREFLETELLPPPSTCYGMLLSLVGEEDRNRHVGARVTVGRLGHAARSTVLRTVWRVKKKKEPQGVGENARPDFQELWCNSSLVIWLDSGEESEPPTLEQRVRVALSDPASIRRFGGLSLGESTHLVDEVRELGAGEIDGGVDTFVADVMGRYTLPVWVDHVGTSGTRFCRGNIESLSAVPDTSRLASIQP